MSTLLLGASALFFIVGLIVPIPAAGNTIVLLLFAALTSRFLFFLVFFRTLQGQQRPNAKVAAFQCVVWFLFAVAFFTFVVLYQFRELL